MKKYVKPAISVFAVESQPILAASFPSGVDNTYDFGTDLIGGRPQAPITAVAPSRYGTSMKSESITTDFV